MKAESMCIYISTQPFASIMIRIRFVVNTMLYYLRTYHDSYNFCKTSVYGHYGELCDWSRGVMWLQADWLDWA